MWSMVAGWVAFFGKVDISICLGHKLAMTTRIAIDHRHPEKAHRPDNPIQRKPAWIRVKAPGHPVYRETRDLMRANGLTTVCEEAACPNIGECW